MKLLAQGIELKKKSDIRCCDLDLGPMTLKLNRDLDILKMYSQLKMNLPG